jgi:hypothetical protein
MLTQLKVVEYTPIVGIGHSIAKYLILALYLMRAAASRHAPIRAKVLETKRLHPVLEKAAS